nr:SpaH/EbpB family LPXTG-anchored major pilin [Arcanobacterium pluranimalium]
MKSMRMKVAAAIALVATFAVGGIHSAQAADVVDVNAPVILNIHKLLGDPEPGNTGAPTKGQTPLSGISFKVEKIEGVDLTTQAGWTELSTMTASNLGDNSVGASWTKVTDGSGLASFTTTADSGFTVGVYRVTEIQKGGYTVAAPFLITLPYSGANGTWTYTRDVYPKNQTFQPDKQVDDTNATLGTNLSYTINTPVPAGDLSLFKIVDPLATNLTLQQPATVTFTGVSAPTLAAGIDYTLDYTSNTLTVNFTQTGLDALKAARLTDPTLAVHVAFKATVNSIPANGQITNTATVTFPTGSMTTNADINGTSTPTSTTFANLTITKTGTGVTDNAQMNGAKFELYLCADSNADGKYELNGSALSVATANDATSVGTVITTANGSGSTASTGLGYAIPVSSFAGGTAGTQVNTYCVLETQAPAGFVRNPEPQLVTFTPDGTGATAGAFSVTVNNEKDSLLGQLPATGAFGIVIIFLIGLALLARGFYTSRRDSKVNTAA